MRMTYDPEADAIYITLKGHGVDHTERVGADIAIDYGTDREIHGIEILSARQHFGFEEETPEISLQNLKAITA